MTLLYHNFNLLKYLTSLTHQEARKIISVLFAQNMDNIHQSKH